MFEIIENGSSSLEIKMIGIGSAGRNVINYMIEQGLQEVKYVAVDTKPPVLSNLHNAQKSPQNISPPEHIEITSEQFIEEEGIDLLKERLAPVIKKTDLIFLMTELDGKVEADISLTVANIAREMNILTIAIVANQRSAGSDTLSCSQELMTLRQAVDSMIVVPQNNQAVPAPSVSSKFMHRAISSIVALLAGESMIGIVIADIRALFSNSGMTILGTGTASGSNRAKVAAEQAITTLKAEHKEMSTLQGALINITSDSSFILSEYKEIMNKIRAIVSNDALVIIGTAHDESMAGEIRVTIIATDFNQPL